MLSKAKLKLIRSLELKKNRQSEGLFVAEGPKVVGDLLPYYRPRFIVATRTWLEIGTFPAQTEIIEVTDEELSKTSFLKTPQEVLAVFNMPDVRSSALSFPLSGLTLVLDDVQDPGNLGTIIRTADWFGIRQIICSQGTADAFSPKVVQATMGSIARVKVCYTDLPSYFANLPKGTPVYGTFLEGANIYQHPLSQNGLIVMGNEGNGISPAVSRFVTEKLFIPPYPADAITGESLNVAIATAITCAEFRRRTFQ
ncbi:MAG: RNA methyltransferase [Bacteroidaceae bacterium]|nr:RNA methyltransferase [Bacteroidaceae bacterium]